jgi:hypothetical protein
VSCSACCSAPITRAACHACARVTALRAACRVTNVCSYSNGSNDKTQNSMRSTSARAALRSAPLPALSFTAVYYQSGKPQASATKASFVVVKTFRFAFESKAAGTDPRAQSCMSDSSHLTPRTPHFFAIYSLHLEEGESWQRLNTYTVAAS